MQTVSVNRRQFLKTGAIATALAATGRLPLLSAHTQAEPSVDELSGPHAVKPIRDHLKRFSPAEAPMRKSGQYSLVYDIIHWNWIAGKHGTFANSVLGRVAIERKASDNQVVYEIEQRMRIGGVDNYLEARIICGTGDWNPLRSWTLRSHQTAPGGGRDPLSELTEKGQCGDGRIRIESDNHEYGFSAKNPVVTQWTMLDFLMRKANPALNVTFDLLQDLSLFKPGQLLTYDGLTPVKLKEGNTVTLQTYAQTGQGVLPIHYLLDDLMRPQLITGSLLSWALAG
ncbi:MAG: hypothetical protein CEE38_02965 [Planctomycetes bacterium B3_Pla]|nr:MAG: hypothetical protein CEE38_02965 [Planctomycetes bacterium B3_Pla]